MEVLVEVAVQRYELRRVANWLYFLKFSGFPWQMVIKIKRLQDPLVQVSFLYLRIFSRFIGNDAQDIMIHNTLSIYLHGDSHHHSLTFFCSVINIIIYININIYIYIYSGWRLEKLLGASHSHPQTCIGMSWNIPGDQWS